MISAPPACNLDERNAYMEKDKWVSFFLCLLFGVFGAHKFYEGRILLGIVYLLTLGFAGVGVVIDLFILLFKPNPYYP